MSVFDTFLNLQWIGLGSVPEFIIEFFLWLDSIIYSFVGKLLTLFMDLASVDYIFNMNDFQYIIDGIYLVLGVVVLFVVAINLLQYVINPDRDDGKSLRDIAFRVVKVLILVVLTPTMFEILYNVQHAVISYNVIPRLLLSDSVQEEFNSTDEFTVTVDKSEDTTGEYSDIQDSYTYTKDEMVDSLVEISGNEMAWYVYSGFFYEDDGNTGAEYDIAERLGDKHSWVGWLTGAIVGGLLLYMAAPLWIALVAGGAFGLATNSWTIDTQHYTFEMLHVQVLGGDWDMITAFAPFVQDGSINYLFILSTIAGLFLVYVIFSFCLDLGVRAIKLIFYQVVAPICFFMSIIPGKESTIKNWFAAVGTTWLEVLVRIACICLVVVGTNLIGSMELPSDSFFVQAILVISILAFVKMLPKLFADITGLKSGNMKLGIKGKLSEVLGYKTATRIGKSTINTGKTFGKKLAAGFDSAKNGLGFGYGFQSVDSNGPLARYRKWKVTIAPYSYANKEEQKNAEKAYRETELKKAKGEELIQKYGDSKKYIMNLKGGQYKEMRDTFDKRQQAKDLMQNYENELTAAKAKGDVKKIAEYGKLYNDAKSTYDTLDKEFSNILGQEKFKDVKANYDTMKYVEDRTKIFGNSGNSNSETASTVKPKASRSSSGNVYRASDFANNSRTGNGTRVRPNPVNNPANNSNGQELGNGRPLGGNNTQSQEVQGQTSIFDRNYTPDVTGPIPTRVTPRRVENQNNNQTPYNGSGQETPGQINLFDNNNESQQNDSHRVKVTPRRVTNSQDQNPSNGVNNNQGNTTGAANSQSNGQSTGQSNGPSNNISR